MPLVLLSSVYDVTRIYSSPVRQERDLAGASSLYRTRRRKKQKMKSSRRDMDSYFLKRESANLFTNVLGN